MQNLIVELLQNMQTCEEVLPRRWHCREDHRLHRFPIIAVWCCDNCGAQMTVGSVTWACEMCNYDLCSQCAQLGRNNDDDDEAANHERQGDAAEVQSGVNECDEQPADNCKEAAKLCKKPVTNQTGKNIKGNNRSKPK